LDDEFVDLARFRKAWRKTALLHLHGGQDTHEHTCCLQVLDQGGVLLSVNAVFQTGGLEEETLRHDDLDCTASMWRAAQSEKAARHTRDEVEAR
jgi:hypothetical protein